MKAATGPKAIALRPSFGSIVSASWLVCQLSIVEDLNKEIAKTLSAKAFFLLRRLPLSDPLPETLTQPRMNIGFFSKLFMAFIRVPGIGTRKLVLFSVQLVSPPVLTTLVCTPDLYKIPRIPLDHPHLRLFQWGCMLMTLSIFWKIQRSKHYLSVFYGNGLKLILWV